MNFRANLSAAVSPTFDVSVSTGFARNENRLPPSGSAFEALYYVGMQNYGFKGPGLDKILLSADSVPLNEFFQYAPGDVMQRYRPQIVQRMTLGTSGELAAGCVAGERNVRRHRLRRSRQLRSVPARRVRANRCRSIGRRLRCEEQQPLRVRQGVSTGSVESEAWANFKTTVGGEYSNVESDGANSSGITLPPGGMTSVKRLRETADRPGRSPPRRWDCSCRSRARSATDCS